MNNFRTLLLIPVLVIQLLGLLTNISWKSLQLTEFDTEVCKDVKRETPAKIVEPAADFQLIKKEEFPGFNNPICRKETPLKCEIQPVVISKKRVNLSVKKASAGNQRVIQKSSAISKISFNGTVTAVLY